MFFRRKKKNRRFSRDHILDVKLSSTQRRQNRLRRVGITLGVCFVVFFGVFVVWRGGEWLLREFIYENPAFAIHQIDAETDGVIALEQLRSWAGVKLRDNLYALDLARVERDLKLVPAIERVTVERVLPHTLRIRVTEREPVAQAVFPQWRAGGAYDRGLYTIDAAGYFMFPVEGQQRATPAASTNDHLPSLTGLPVSDMRPGRQVESPQVRAALELIRAFDNSPMTGLAELKQIDVSASGILTVTTGQSSEVVFGLNDLEGQLRRWRAAYDHGQKTGKHVAWLDLSVSNNVPARWLEASFVPSAPVKSVKPSPYKKKHV